jgi:hypothetical protein
MYHLRLIDKHLSDWKNDPHRKPLILRGARQVGKSSAVRKLAEQFDNFVEINFEISPGFKSIFASDLQPKRIVEDLSIFLGQLIVPGQTLLFLDEIQACPEAISSLRFFYEKVPELHVIAAGSLLEFALQELPSYGVGRVRSLFMYPFSFDEFLLAMGEKLLLEARQKAGPKNPLSTLLHEKLLDLLKTFLLIGGMPEAIAFYVANRQMLSTQQILDDLYLSLKNDFTKYKSRVPATRLSEVVESVVNQGGGKFVYTRVSSTSNHGQIKEALDLLVMAGIVIPVTHTAANGIPLGAEIDPRKRKMLLLDTGIYQRILGLDLADYLFDSENSLVHKGSIAEQFWGLEFLKYSSVYTNPALHYWHRESANANAEVDYVVQKGPDIWPIEVKSSGKGSMQSLRQFLKDKNRPYGFRFSLENFSEYEDVKVYPLYAVGNFVLEAPPTS